MEIKEVEIGKLLPWDENPRVNENAVDAVAKSIEQYGFNVPILCDQHMTIIAGHVRWKAATKVGMETVPVIQITLTRAQREAFAIADNKTAEIADWDYDALAHILEDLPGEEIDLSSLGFSEAELDAILRPEEDFDWDAFQENIEESQNDATHILLPVKVPMGLKEDVKNAIREHARQRNIGEKDAARLAGLIFMSLLGVSPCRSR